MKLKQGWEDFIIFFENYKSFSEQLIQKDLINYSSIFQKVKTITEDGLKEEEGLTSPYNIFNILKIEKNEDETHTPFLLDLFNIRGSHCQKDLFYRLLLEEIITDKDERSKFLPDNPRFFTITGQKGIGDDTYGQGFLDVFIDYIDPGRKSFSIVIENKIFHYDGNNQLNKYHSFLESLYRDNILLIYLTPDGKTPDSISMKPERVKELQDKGQLKLVSYQKHIKSVLTKSVNTQKPDHVKSDKVKYTILQYQTLIENILKIPNMEPYKEKLCEYLTNSVENFNYSRQIVDLYESGEFNGFIKMYYLKDLLRKIESQINQSSEGWKSQFKDYPEWDEIDLYIFKEDWNGLSIGWCVLSNEIGICCQPDFKFNKEWRTRINEYLRNSDSKGNMKEENPSWLWWENFNFNLNDYNIMFKIIPINSEITSKDISNQLIRYSSMYENQIKDLLKLK